MTWRRAVPPIVFSTLWIPGDKSTAVCPVGVNVAEKAKGVRECTYVPEKGLKHTIQVNYGGVATNNSPYRVYVSEPTDASKVQVFGPGVEPGVKAHAPTYFNVDARQAGPGTH